MSLMKEVRKTSEYEQLTIEKTIKLLETSINGLTESEARNRLEKFGYNEVVEKERPPILDFLSRYWGPMPWLLELTIVLSYVLHRNLEVAIIFGLLTINVVIGFQHSRGSRRALNLLKKRLAVKAKVLRDGEWVTKDAREIAPGDIIAIQYGDLIPADAKIIGGEVSVDQSALTGESLPVTMHESGIVYSSSIVKRGEASCLALNTGMNTYFGRAVELVKIAKPFSHQEQIMMAVVRYMMYVSIATLALIAVDATFAHFGIVSILTLALTFLMGAVPVALPAVFAVVLAVGAMELAEKGVLVTRLDSIEDAASMEILCLDKTGTITQNKLSVIDAVPFSGYRKEDVVIIASLASKEESKDVTDLAMIEYSRTTGMDLGIFKQISFTPFDSSIKRSEAIIQAGAQRFRAVKGAPQVIVSLCTRIDEETRRRINRTVEELSQRGYRTLAVARSEGNDLNDLRFVGLLPLADPPRPDSRTMIEELRALGVRPKMLTGDNIAIAKEIGRQVSIGPRIRRMIDLEGLDEAEQMKILEESDGLAEVYPEDKYRIVRLLQSGGHMVGMTGDGVNDSPALKQAEVGIAVSNSTDVTKASSSIVLTQPGTREILDAIVTSRQIYQRMLTWVINKVAKVIQFIGLLALGFFWLHEVLLSLLGMVLLLFANDFVTMSLATDNAKHTSSPNLWNVRNITLASLVIGALLIVEGVIGVFIALNYFHLGGEALQTFVMLMLIFTSQFRVLVVRERRHFWNSRPGRELLISSILAIGGFAVLGIYGLIIPPLKLYEVLFILGFSALFTLGVDFPKYYTFRKFGL